MAKEENKQEQEQTKAKRKGAPKKQIDQGQFEGLCRLQCTREEICEWFGVTDVTLNRWCRETYDGQTFSEVFKQKRATGKVSLRRTLWKQADMNVAAAIFLAKNHLGMSDKVEHNYNGSIPVVITGGDDLKD